MKLKPSVKWAIAAAATVTTVTVSMGVIASAYPYDQGVTSGDGFGILGDSNDSKIGSRRNGYDFEFTDQKPALEQVAKFALSVDIPAQATIKFGGYNAGIIKTAAEMNSVSSRKVGVITATWNILLLTIIKPSWQTESSGWSLRKTHIQ